MPKWDPAPDRGLWALSDTRLSNPAKMRKKCCYVCEKNLGQHSSLPLSPTHLSLSRIKRERYIFVKKCIRSFIEVCILCLIMFLLIFVLRLCNKTCQKQSTIGRGGERGSEISVIARHDDDDDDDDIIWFVTILLKHFKINLNSLYLYTIQIKNHNLTSVICLHT